MIERWAAPTILNGRYRGFVLVSNTGRVKIREGERWKLRRTRTNRSGYSIVQIGGRVHYVCTLQQGIDWRNQPCALAGQIRQQPYARNGSRNRPPEQVAL